MELSVKPLNKTLQPQPQAPVPYKLLIGKTFLAPKSKIAVRNRQLAMQNRLDSNKKSEQRHGIRPPRHSNKHPLAIAAYKVADPYLLQKLFFKPVHTTVIFYGIFPFDCRTTALPGKEPFLSPEWQYTQ